LNPIYQTDMLLALVVVLYKVLDLVLNLQTILELIVLLDLKVQGNTRS